MIYLTFAVLFIIFFAFVLTLADITQEGGGSKFFSLYVRATQYAETIQDEKEQSDALKEVQNMRESIIRQVHILIFTSFILGIAACYYFLFEI